MHRNDLIVRTAGVALVGLSAAAAGDAMARRQPVLNPAEAFLASRLQLRADDFRDLTRRQAFARTLDTTDGREVATAGVIRVRVPPEFYVQQLRHIASFKKDAAVLQIGTFGAPARADEAASLTLEEDDAEKMDSCRPGSCKVQLSSDAIQRFQREVAWKTPGARAAADALMRDILARMVTRYQAEGETALMTYADSSKPLPVANEFRAMIDARPDVLAWVPTLRRHVLQYPRTQGSVHDVFYWAKERMGPAVVISVTHLAIAEISDVPPIAFAAASKQLYGSRYFDTSLGLTVLLRDDTPGGGGAYLIYVNRSRIDALGGILGGLKRAIVRSRTKSAMSKSLVTARDLVERRYAEAGR